MVIRIITYGYTKEEGFAKAQKVANDLCDEKRLSFDYAQDFKSKGSKMSGSGRWGKKPYCVLADSKQGKNLIDDGLHNQKVSFSEKLDEMKDYLEYTNDELFEGEIIEDKSKVLDRLNQRVLNLDMFRYYCSCLGQYYGSEIFLYNCDGEGIRNKRELKRALDKYDNGVDVVTQSGEKVWVSPFDVHF